MQIFIFRHGEKQNTFDHDPDLTPRGLIQAQNLAKKVELKQLPQPDLIFASPKIRAQRSFQYLSKSTQVKIQTSELLLERAGTESRNEFRRRVLGFLQKVAESPGNCAFVCTHYDWALETMLSIPTDHDLTGQNFVHWYPLQFVGFRYQNGIYHYLQFGTCDDVD